MSMGHCLSQINPATGEVIGKVRFGTVEDYERVVCAQCHFSKSTPSLRVVRVLILAACDEHDAHLTL